MTNNNIYNIVRKIKIGGIMRKTRKQTKQRKIVVLSMICLLSIMTIGYAAFQTNINITAKGNIKDNNAAWQLKKKVVNSGDGLYKDQYEDNRYIYKGANPENYITFNNETWRIMSVENDETLKIIRNESIGKKLWDTGVGVWGYNDWTRPAVVNSYLNDDYYNSLNGDKAIIESHIWNIGAVTHGNSDLANQIVEEKAKNWDGKVGLISVSDYLKANSNTSQCGNFSLNNSNMETCKQTNFLVQSERFWTITAYDKIVLNTSTVVFNITNSGGIGSESAGYASYDILPTVYLKNTIILKGLGTESQPYVVHSY